MEPEAECYLERGRETGRPTGTVRTDTPYKSRNAATIATTSNKTAPSTFLRYAMYAAAHKQPMTRSTPISVSRPAVE